MPETLTFTPESEVEFSASLTDEPAVEAVQLENLSFVLDVEHEDGVVTECTVDISRLVQAMTLYSAMEEHRYDWR